MTPGNGLFFYHYPDRSIGFTPTGFAVELSARGVAIESQSARSRNRHLSWSLTGPEFRCGTVTETHADAGMYRKIAFAFTPAAAVVAAALLDMACDNAQWSPAADAALLKLAADRSRALALAGTVLLADQKPADLFPRATAAIAASSVEGPAESLRLSRLVSERFCWQPPSGSQQGSGSARDMTEPLPDVAPPVSLTTFVEGGLRATGGARSSRVPLRGILLSLDESEPVGVGTAAPGSIVAGGGGGTAGRGGLTGGPMTALNERSPEQLAARYAVLKAFNATLEPALRFFDYSGLLSAPSSNSTAADSISAALAAGPVGSTLPAGSSFLAAALVAYKGMLHPELSARVLSDALERSVTETEGPWVTRFRPALPAVWANRLIAIAANKRAGPGDASQTIFDSLRRGLETRSFVVPSKSKTPWMVNLEASPRILPLLQRFLYPL